MVSFTQVDPNEIDTTRVGRRGRVSYPIIKSFMEANIKCAKLDMTGINKRPESLRAGLASYIQKHSIPIKIFSVHGDLHLMRLDMDNDGNPIEDWDQKQKREQEESSRRAAAKPIDSKEVEVRFLDEKGQTTK